jgi:hypothetical protein
MNDQYRLTFRWEEGNACEVSVEDYHQIPGLARDAPAGRLGSRSGSPAGVVSGSW